MITIFLMRKYRTVLFPIFLIMYCIILPDLLYEFRFEGDEHPEQDLWFSNANWNFLLSTLNYVFFLFLTIITFGFRYAGVSSLFFTAVYYMLLTNLGEIYDTSGYITLSLLAEFNKLGFWHYSFPSKFFSSPYTDADLYIQISRFESISLIKIGATSIVVYMIVKCLFVRFGKIGHILFSLATFIFIILVLFHFFRSENYGGVLFFIYLPLLLPIANIISDFISLGATRYILRHSIIFERNWIFPFSMIDLFLAISLLVLGFYIYVNIVAILEYIREAEYNIQVKSLQFVHPWQMISHHLGSDRWVILVFATTLVPTLVHFCIGCASIAAYVPQSICIRIAGEVEKIDLEKLGDLERPYLEDESKKYFIMSILSLWVSASMIAAILMAYGLYNVAIYIFY